MLLHILGFINSPSCLAFVCRNRRRGILLTLEAHLDCQLGVPVNDVAMNVLACVLWYTPFGAHLYTFLPDINLGVDLLVSEHTYAQFECQIASNMSDQIYTPNSRGLSAGVLSFSSRPFDRYVMR